MSDYGAGPSQQRQSEERSDGISEMTGHATFSSGSVSISISIAANGGSFTGTGDFEAGGAVGDSISSTPTTASVKGGVLSASGLTGATSGSNYSVMINYKLNGVQATALTGTIKSAPATGNKNLTVQ
jgi:hypothetical protein